MLKCMVCGDLLLFVNHTHLRKHGLTIQQYKERFNGQIYSAEYWQKRTIQRPCRMCGSTFTTKNPTVFYCPGCQPKVSLEKQRRSVRLYQLKRKRTLHIREVGTFSERHLEIVNGRVLGTVLLERGLSPNSPSIHNGGSLQCEGCGSNMLINIVDHEPYCSECGAKIVVARENEHYSMLIEPVCSSCGLVYDTKNFPLFFFWGENHLSRHPVGQN